ncbi:MAG: hypothetical protein KF787_08430 [Phycisphaeraceae bacterium]|nr:hypothetical protein [Phycisphaerae bacterium]MBX3392661.1 hypothetical protein [Phycisphaeraceae bacterium]
MKFSIGIKVAMVLGLAAWSASAGEHFAIQPIGHVPNHTFNGWLNTQVGTISRHGVRPSVPYAYDNRPLSIGAVPGGVAADLTDGMMSTALLPGGGVLHGGGRRERGAIKIRDAYANGIFAMEAAATSAFLFQPAAKVSVPEIPLVKPFVPDHTPTWEELGELAASLGAGSYGVLNDVGVVTVISGTLLGVGALEGELYREGDVIPNGPVWNPSDEDVLITTRHPHDPYTIEVMIKANGVVHNGWLAKSGWKSDPGHQPGNAGSSAAQEDEAPPGCPQSVSVTCVSGYYACCYYIIKTGCARAVCVKNGDPPPLPCSAGGVGSSTCSLTVP